MATDHGLRTTDHTGRRLEMAVGSWEMGTKLKVENRKLT
jgi:hypothetical protein